MKKLKKEQITELLYKYANMKITKDNKDYNTLYECILMHPRYEEKIGVGIDYFYVKPSIWKVNQFNFMISRIDGTSTDFSYIKCFRQDKTSKENWNQIFRKIIKPQMDEFRTAAYESFGNGDYFICQGSGLKIKKIYSHIDHVFPLTFDSIYLEFIKNNNIDLSKIELTDDPTDGDVKMIKDDDIKQKFYEFHKKRAVLRIVYSKVNLQAKKTKNYNGLNPEKVKIELLKTYPQFK